MTTHTNIHTAKTFEPSDYVVLDYLDNRRPIYMGGSVEAFAADVKMWETDMQAILGADWMRKKNHCIHCGNGNVRWITAVMHNPTGDTVVFGSDCTDRLGFENHQAFKLALLQSRAAANQVRFKAYRKRVAFLEANPEVVQMIEDAAKPEHLKNGFIQDVINKLNTYGELSARQIEAVKTAMKRDTDYIARKAAEVVEVKGDAPSGRVTVSGVVLSTKWSSGAWGDQLKMLVKLANNSKVWLSCTDSEIKRDSKVTVKATFEVSKDDKSFAFGKRPIIISHEATVNA